MGMFDSVYIRCKCGDEVEFQSKAHDCILRSYNENDVPDVIAEDLDGVSKDCECGRVITLRYRPPREPGYLEVEIRED